MRWREETILAALADLLVVEGCVDVTMDSLAGRVGIAKGSLYLHTRTRGELVERLLDQWASDVEVPARDGSGSPDGDRLLRLCTAMLTVCERGANGFVPAIPCCLHASPCPHEWPQRWSSFVEQCGIEAEPEVALVGEALQALATMPKVQAEFAAGNGPGAQRTVLRFLEGYLSEEPAEVLERDA